MAFAYDQKIGKYTYTYNIESYWDKDKKQPRQRRIFLGRKDPLTGEIIDTKNIEKSIPVQSYDFGVTYFCKNIISKLGLDRK